MRHLPALLCCALAATAPAAAPAAAPAVKYRLMTSAGSIGTLTIEVKGKSIDNDWKVDDNGRGSKIKEHVELGKDGRPVKWDISGAGWFGAPVKESFTLEGTKAKWISLDDSGEADGKDAIYSPNNGTPWATVLNLKLLLTSKGMTRAVLPSGTMRLEKLREVEISNGKTKEKVTAWALWGLDLSPSFLLARKDVLVAGLSPGWVFAEEQYEKSFEPLSKLAAELSGEAMKKLVAKIAHPAQSLWLTQVRVFDSETGKLGAPTNVGVFQDRIVYVGPDAPPADAQVVDGKGKTLLPGLIDSHAHLGIWDGPMHLACGVTMGRDPGNDNTQLLTLLEGIDRGDFVGPRMRTSGFIEGQSPFSAHLGYVISTVDEAKEKVRWYAAHGFWGIKLYNSMNPDFVKPIAEEAHRLGLHVSGHVPAFMSSTRAVKDGYDEINHINQLVLSLMIDVAKEDTRTPFRFTALGERTAKLDLKGEPFKALLKLMKEKKTALDPTMATFSGLLLPRPGKASPMDEPWLGHVPVTLQRARKSVPLDVKPEQYPVYDASWKKLEETLLLLHQSGIVLVPGTDDVAGLGLLSELESWVRAGIPPAEVLKAATLGGAKFLGLDGSVGKVARGQLADLYLVDGDPTADIAALRKGLLVVKGGSYFYPDEIHQSLGISPFAPHAAVAAQAR